jgi:hypothetical protein
MGVQTLRCTVRLSPAEPGGIEVFKRVVVGVDEHEGSLDAIGLAKNLLAGDGDRNGACPGA